MDRIHLQETKEFLNANRSEANLWESQGKKIEPAEENVFRGENQGSAVVQFQQKAIL